MGLGDAQWYSVRGWMSDGAAFGAEPQEIVTNGDLPPAKLGELVLVRVRCTELTRALRLQQSLMWDTLAGEAVLVGELWPFWAETGIEREAKPRAKKKKPTEAVCFLIKTLRSLFQRTMHTR